MLGNNLHPAHLAPTSNVQRTHPDEGADGWLSKKKKMDNDKLTISYHLFTILFIFLIFNFYLVKEVTISETVFFFLMIRDAKKNT